MLRKFSALFCVALISVAFVGCAPADPDATIDTPTVDTPNLDTPDYDAPDYDATEGDLDADATEPAPIVDGEGDVEVVEEVPTDE